jgi:hypothetical protein
MKKDKFVVSEQLYVFDLLKGDTVANKTILVLRLYENSHRLDALDQHYLRIEVESLISESIGIFNQGDQTYEILIHLRNRLPYLIKEDTALNDIKRLAGI